MDLNAFQGMTLTDITVTAEDGRLRVEGRVQSLPTPPAQEAHTQPGDSRDAGQDVRRPSCSVCGRVPGNGWLRHTDDGETCCEDCGAGRDTGDVWDAGRAAALAEVRAAVEAWYIDTALNEGQDYLRMLALIGRLAGEGK